MNATPPANSPVGNRASDQVSTLQTRFSQLSLSGSPASPSVPVPTASSQPSSPPFMQHTSSSSHNPQAPSQYCQTSSPSSLGAWQHSGTITASPNSGSTFASRPHGGQISPPRPHAHVHNSPLSSSSSSATNPHRPNSQHLAATPSPNRAHESSTSSPATAVPVNVSSFHNQSPPSNNHLGTALPRAVGLSLGGAPQPSESSSSMTDDEDEEFEREHMSELTFMMSNFCEVDPKPSTSGFMPYIY